MAITILRRFTPPVNVFVKSAFIIYSGALPVSRKPTILRFPGLHHQIYAKPAGKDTVEVAVVITPYATDWLSLNKNTII